MRREQHYSLPIYKQKKMAQILQLMGSVAKEIEEQYQSMNEALKFSSIK